MMESEISILREELVAIKSMLDELLKRSPATEVFIGKRIHRSECINELSTALSKA